MDDVSRIYDHIAGHNPPAAERLAEAILAGGDSLIDMPRRGRPVGDNLREIVPVYPYILRYEIAGGAVQILRVRHGARQQ